MPNERQLSDVLSEFARTMLTDFPIQGILDHLVTRIAEVLSVSSAGVTLISPDRAPHYVAASDGAALTYEKLQSSVADGPCVAAYQTGEAVFVPDLTTELRFPLFTPKALDAGLKAVFTFPLRHGNERLGALDLYCDSPGPLNPARASAAQTLADVASAYLLNAQARADLRESSAQAHETALRDPLTGLPNRRLLVERLDHTLLRGGRTGKTAAVLFADLDRFKLVNDLYGHGVGDELLIAVAQRLSAVLRPGDTLARLSGDEFVIICEGLSDPPDITPVTDRLLDAFERPFHLSSAEVDITASVGVAFIGRGLQYSEEILEEADAAMYQAKRDGGARHKVIDLREQQLAGERTRLEHDLHGATDRGELRNRYQPIVCTDDGRMTGVEALLRWAHPTNGLVLPTVLIPIAERSGLICEIGKWVLEEACADLRRWQDSDGRATTMSVNVSATQIMSPGFARSVDAVLENSGTEPDLVTLEVTESVFLQDSQRALVVLSDLKRIGVKLALDDFGTGHSSLNYLRRFPIDIVKIDRGFVAELDGDTASDAIVFAIVQLAHLLGMTVTAEGVETTEQHQHLAALGCDFCQGYFFTKAVTPAVMGKLIEDARPGGAVHLPSLVGTNA